MLVGWNHNKATRFNMRQPFDVMKGAEGWQLSNPPILSMAAIKASLDLFDEVGMDALREKSLKLTGYFEFLINEIDSEEITIITPSNPKERGCQISIQVKNSDKNLHKKLTAQNVITDWREPDVIRCAPVPFYTSFEGGVSNGFYFKRTVKKIVIRPPELRNLIFYTAQKLVERKLEKMQKKDKIVIIGAGLCGSLLALRFAQRGHKVAVYESRPDLRKTAVSAGRSINLALSDRGLKALRLCGLEAVAKEICIPMYGRLMHDAAGNTFASNYSGRDGEYINSISRGDFKWDSINGSRTT